jgi:hypothetical protein
MRKPTAIAKSPREHLMRARDDEFSKFERKEKAFRQADRDERAAKFGLPLRQSRPSMDSPAEGLISVACPQNP